MNGTSTFVFLFGKPILSIDADGTTKLCEGATLEHVGRAMLAAQRAQEELREELTRRTRLLLGVGA